MKGKAAKLAESASGGGSSNVDKEREAMRLKMEAELKAAGLEMNNQAMPGS